VSDCCDTELVCPCPPIGLIDVVGKKWAVCVISLLGKYGTTRFGPIQQCLSGVSPATLTATLRALEGARLVHRRPAESPRGPVLAYQLTAKGALLNERLRPLAEWLQDAQQVRRPPPGGGARI
jgi:DNA-binding HxlR family transcriptional regulator